jgi:hypothetical protein
MTETKDDGKQHPSSRPQVSAQHDFHSLLRGPPQRLLREPPQRPVYLLRVQSLRGDDIRKLRLLLKMLLRRLELKCISIEEVQQ